MGVTRRLNHFDDPSLQIWFIIAAFGAVLVACGIGSLFMQVGQIVILTTRTLVSAVRPPYPYGEELVWQFLFVLKLSWFPLLISTIAISYGAPGLQAGNFLVTVQRS